MTEKRYQIRTAAGGIGLYNGVNAAEALLKFLTNRARADLRHVVAALDETSAEAEYQGTVYRAVEFPDE